MPGAASAGFNQIKLVLAYLTRACLVVHNAGDHGLAGLLSRVVKVSDKAWAQHMRAVQAGMRDR